MNHGRMLLGALLTGVLAGAVTYGSPAEAHDPEETDTGVLVHSWTGPTFYLDRPTTQHLAELLRTWDNSGQALTQAGPALGCLRAGNLVAIGICEAVVTVAGSYLLDQVQQADNTRGCLEISLRFGLPRVSAYNDDGQYCRGERSN